MAILRKTDIHALDDAKIDEKIAELKEQMLIERAQPLAGKGVSNKRREMRRTIARLLTERSLRAKNKISQKRDEKQMNAPG